MTRTAATLAVLAVVLAAALGGCFVRQQNRPANDASNVSGEANTPPEEPEAEPSSAVAGYDVRGAPRHPD